MTTTAWTALIAVVMYPAVSLGDAKNRNLLPLGERASTLGNAGITSPTTEATFYNPANLVRLAGDNLSASGSVYNIFSYEADAIASVDGDDVPFSAGSFYSVPSALISTYSAGSWRLATSILVPDYFRYEAEKQVTFRPIRVNQISRSRIEQLWLGVSAAKPVGQRFAIGISVFGLRTSESLHHVTSFAPFELDTSEVVFTQTTSSTKLDAIALSSVVGVFWQALPDLVVGARLHPGTVGLYGRGDKYLARSDSDGTTANFQEAAAKDYPADSPLPWDIGVGVAFSVGPNLEVVGDVNLQLPTTQVFYDHADAGRRAAKLDAAPRLNLGTEWGIAENRWIRLGFTYNKSASTSESQSYGDFVGGTLGFAYTGGRTTTSVGAYYQQSVGGFETPEPGRRADTVTRNLGALLSASYQL